MNDAHSLGKITINRLIIKCNQPITTKENLYQLTPANVLDADCANTPVPWKKAKKFEPRPLQNTSCPHETRPQFCLILPLLR